MYGNPAAAGRSEVNLVEQILEQGQRLRNSMVRSILSQDPFYDHLTPRPPQKMHAICMDEEKCDLSTEDKHKFVAYLRGEDMTRADEKTALQTFRAMSNTDICEVTQRSYSSLQNGCDCDTCKAYYKRDFAAADVVPPLNLKSGRLSSGRMDKPQYFEYVDTLKIAVHSLKLSHEGEMKVSSSFTNKNPRISQNLATTYFIEYDIPAQMVKSSTKKAKVDTGLETSNVVKLCSKRLHKEAIYFKQISIHDVTNLHRLDLDSVDIKFTVSCRSSRQKGVNVIGQARFNMGSFRDTKYLSCNQELAVVLKQGTPIVLGSIKIGLQLGAGRLYFGKEFLDSISNNKENNVILPEIISFENDDEDEGSFHEAPCRDVDARGVSDTARKDQETRGMPSKDMETRVMPGKDKETRGLPSKESLKPCRRKAKETITEPQQQQQLEHPKPRIADKIVLFGFIYVSEVEYLDLKDSTYFTCQPFCQNELINSTTVTGGLNPIFNFQQKIPLIYEEDFISRLRDNFMIFEFWEKRSYKDELIGVCSIPLHQYYLAFRNPVIVNYLNRNKLPVISTDWYEPISHPTTGTINGQVLILIALGSEVQVQNLEAERGFKDNIVTRAKRSLITRRPLIGEPVQVAKSDRVSFTNVRAKLNSAKSILEKNNLSDEAWLRNCSAEKTESLNLNENFLNSCSRDRYDEGFAERTRSVHLDEIQSVSARIDSVNPIQSESKIEFSVNPIRFESLEPQKFSVNPVRDEVPTSEVSSTVDKASQSDPIAMENQTSNPLETLLQQFLTTRAQQVETGTNTDDNFRPQKDANDVRKTTDLLDSLSKALTIDCGPPADTFKAHIVVESALHLPTRKKCKAKKVKGKYVREEIQPSAYVTFETEHEGNLMVTPVVHRSSRPKWDFRCDVSLPTDLLMNNQKRMIFKVWKKANNTSAQPNMQVDTVLGFAALDLTVLLAGLPTVQGWFNIVDFSSKCNGQIKINVTPLENISKYNTHKTSSNPPSHANASVTPPAETLPEEPGELLGRALKRKFIELDEITQRLRSRLSRVTNDESDASNDDVADEFEKDINTLCVEDDYDMVNFVREAQKVNMQQVSSSLKKWQGLPEPDNQTLLLFNDDEEPESPTFDSLLFINTGSNEPALAQNTLILTNTRNFTDESDSASCSSTTAAALDRQLIEGKTRIDTLLQKLSLISKDSEPFSSRYVSGCSVSRETSKNSTEEDIMQELGIDSQFSASQLFDASLFREGLKSTSSSSVGSIVTPAGNERDAPDGEGNTSAEKRGV